MLHNALRARRGTRRIKNLEENVAAFQVSDVSSRQLAVTAEPYPDGMLPAVSCIVIPHHMRMTLRCAVRAMSDRFD